MALVVCKPTSLTPQKQTRQGVLLFCLRKQNILNRHREELHLMATLIRNHALCNSVAIYLCLYTSLIPTLAISRTTTEYNRSATKLKQRKTPTSGHRSSTRSPPSCVPLLGVTSLYILLPPLRESRRCCILATKKKHSRNIVSA